MDSINTQTPASVKTTLVFRLDASQGDSYGISVGAPSDMRQDLREVDIIELPDCDQDFTLDGAGFQLVGHRAEVNDFHDEGTVQSKYYGEISALAKEITGASLAHCYQHILRASKLEGHPSPAKNVYGPAHGPHVDYNYVDTPEYIRTLPGRPANWDHLSKSRWAILSAWRPMNKVTRDALCVGDKRTIPDEDLINGATGLRASGRTKRIGLFRVIFNPAHKYYYKNGMGVDDVLWIKLFDSKLDGRARCTPHCAFKSPEDHGDARTSIETRCIVVWEGESLT